MAPKPKQTKAKIAQAAASSSKGKKKWSKGKDREKVHHAVGFDETAFEKLSEIPKSKLITPAIVSDRLKITVSLAIEAIRDMYAKGLIRRVGEPHSKHLIYSRAN